MRVVIVFESMFGNTESIACEIAAGFATEGTAAKLAEVRHVRPEDVRPCDLLVVGAPTHAFSLSRPSTRADAVRQGAEQSRAALGVREWLATVADLWPVAEARPAVAVFDSRVEKAKNWPGSAARRASRTLRAQGFDIIDQPRSFYVLDVKGPLADGERERARGWAGRLTQLVRSHQGDAAAS